MIRGIFLNVLCFTTFFEIVKQRTGERDSSGTGSCSCPVICGSLCRWQEYRCNFGKKSLSLIALLTATLSPVPPRTLRLLFLKDQRKKLPAFSGGQVLFQPSGAQGGYGNEISETRTGTRRATPGISCPKRQGVDPGSDCSADRGRI